MQKHPVIINYMTLPVLREVRLGATRTVTQPMSCQVAPRGACSAKRTGWQDLTWQRACVRVSGLCFSTECLQAVEHLGC